MKVLPQYLTGGEVEELAALWRRTRDIGWVARRRDRAEAEDKRVYDFVPCLEPPPGLLARVLAELPQESGMNYWDSFFLYYRTGDHVPAHIDNRSGARFNSCLITPRAGGHLLVRGRQVRLDVRDAVVFEPDVEMHSVTRVQGERLIWSVGRTRDPYCGGNEKFLQNQDPKWSPSI